MNQILKKCLIGIPASIMFAVCAQAATGPSSSETPYLTPASNKVEITSILTVGDAVRKNNPANASDTSFRLVGIPDGMGAIDNQDGTITLLVNHEIRETQGVVRAHGSKGAFVSKFRIRKDDLKVLRGEDLIKNVYLYNDSTGKWDLSTTAFSRFCSGDLAAKTAFYNAKSDKGFFDGDIYLNGEEAGPTGRAFAHIATGPLAGNSYELPSLGNASWENNVAQPKAMDKTIVISLDDTNLGKVYVHGAQKTKEAGPIAAGLHAGINTAIAIKGYSLELRDSFPSAGTRFSLVSPTDTAGTQFLRPEDGAWDTQNPNRFYFVTTDRYDQVKDGVGLTIGRTRLWRLTFDDLNNPLQGGTVEAMLDGTEEGQMFDNLTVNAEGHVIIQEDVGGQAHNGKIWSYNPVNDQLTLLAKHDVARFGDIGIPATAPHNNDEESSGVIEVTEMFEGVPGYDTKSNRYYFLNVQAHSNLSDVELVQRGQLLLMKVAK